MPKNKNDNPNQYLQYMSVGFQLVGGVAIGIWIGHWIDKKFSFATPLFMWVLPMLIVFGLLYQLIKQFSGKRKNRQ